MAVIMIKCPRTGFARFNRNRDRRYDLRDAFRQLGFGRLLHLRP